MSMIVNRFDMSYLGVYDVWFREIGMFNLLKQLF